MRSGTRRVNGARVSRRSATVALALCFAVACGGRTDTAGPSRDGNGGRGGVSASGAGSATGAGATTSGSGVTTTPGGGATTPAGGVTTMPGGVTTTPGSGGRPPFTGSGGASAGGALVYDAGRGIPPDASPPGCSSGICPPPPGQDLCGGVVCRTGEQCCLTTLKCFEPKDRGPCPVPELSDAQGRRPCAANVDCAPDEFCGTENPFFCSGVGSCQSRTNCGSSSDYAWCGCNGKTYPNYQSACFDGVRAVTQVACGSFGYTKPVTPPGTACGADRQCPEGQHCCAITGLCYDIGREAICALPPPGKSAVCLDNSDCYAGYEFCDGAGCAGPGACTPLISSTCSGQDPSQCSCNGPASPVCGCDGTTYTNAGCAHSHGNRVASTGPCGPLDAGPD